MDFLNKSLAQLNELFRSMSPGARITSGLLLVVVVVSLVFLFRLESSSPDDYLLAGHVFSNRDLTAAIGALSQAKLSHFEVEGSRIRVPRGQQDVYVAALVDGKAMPRQIGSWFDELKSSASPFEPQRQRDVRRQLALQSELAGIIGKMYGIEMASVLISELPRTTGLRRITELAASVAVMPIGNSDLESDRVNSIKEFVATAIGGKASNVTVMDMNSGHSYPGDGDSTTPSAMNDQYAGRQQLHEREWTGKIRERLGYIPGVKVATTVILEKELQHTESSVKFDPRTVATKTQSTTLTETTTAAGPAGRPGVIPNAVASNQQATVNQGQGSGSDKEQQTESQEGLASYDQVTKTTAPLTPSRITASVGIPRSYYRNVWESRNQAPDGQPPASPPTQVALDDIESKINQNIQESIVSLLPPVPPGEDKYPQVAVTSYDDQTVAPLPEPSTVEKATSWLAGNWKTLAMLGIGLAGLLMLRSMVKSGPPAPAPSTDLGATLKLLRPEEEAENEESDDETQPAKVKRRFRAADSNPREELTDMVNDNPEAAAAILRSWIAEAS